MAGFDFKKFLKEGIEEKKAGLLVEQEAVSDPSRPTTAMKYDPKTNKVVIGGKRYNFWDNGVIDYNNAEDIHGDLTDELEDPRTGIWYKLRRIIKSKKYGGLTAEGEKRKKSLQKNINVLIELVDEFYSAFQEADENRQDQARTEYRDLNLTPRFWDRFSLQSKHFNNPDGETSRDKNKLIKSLNGIKNRLVDVHKEINSEISPLSNDSARLNVKRTRQEHTTLRVTDEVLKRPGVGGTQAERAKKAKSAANFCLNPDNDGQPVPGAEGFVCKGNAAVAKQTGAQQVAAAKAKKKAAAASVAPAVTGAGGTFVSASVDEQNKVLAVGIKEAEKASLWNNEKIQALSPNGKKQLKAGPGQENSLMNILVKEFARFAGATPKATETLSGYVFRWQFNNLEKQPSYIASRINEVGDRLYKKAYTKAWLAAKPIKGGGLGDLDGEGVWSKLEKFAGVDPSGAYEDVYGPMEESNMLEFEKTLQGAKLEKLHNRLMPKRKKIKEEVDIDWGGAAAPAPATGEAAITAAQKQAMEQAYQAELAKRGVSAETFTFADYIKYKFGADAGKGILKAMGGVAKKVGRGGLEMAKWSVSPAARAAFMTWGGKSVGAAGAGGALGAAAIGLGVGVGIGSLINWAISGTSLESSKDRIRRAKKQPKYADWMLEMFSTGKGHLCGPEAEDGWQVKCSGDAGGFEQYDEEGGWGELGRGAGKLASRAARGARGWFSEAREYTDPTGWRDFVQTKNSFSREDLIEILAYMAILYEEDEKAGLVKTAEKKTEKGKTLSVELQPGSKMLKYKKFYLETVNNFAERAFNRRQKKAYEMVTLALGGEIATLKGTVTGKLTRPERKADRKAAQNVEQVKEIQKALIEYFGPELEAKLGDEYAQGIIGNNTKYAFFNFSSEWPGDPKFPRGRNKLKKMPAFIRQKIAEKEFAAAEADTEIDTMVAESKMNLQQKRLLEMNKRLMKF